jgi:hypothetical protein
MLTLLGALALTIAVIAFVHAAYTEWRQTRDTGPVAIVPTLPMGIAAPILGTLGLVFLGRQNDWARLPWWGYLAMWLVSAAIAVALLLWLGRRT